MLLVLTLRQAMAEGLREFDFLGGVFVDSNGSQLPASHVDEVGQRNGPRVYAR